jgi:hypothetical protein
MYGLVHMLVVISVFQVYNLGKYLLVWISQNLSVPFWMVGHVHLSVNVYEDIHEIIASCGMNLIVAIGFIIDYLEQKKKL